MTITVTAQVDFEAGHKLIDVYDCERDHGHRYTVSVESKEMRDPESAALLLSELAGLLSAIKRELRNRSLNEMIAPATPDSIGLASWVNERLSVMPITEVRVVESSGRAATVRRQ